MFYIYILRSQIDFQLYTGSTADLRKRLMEHNSGKVFATRFRRPLDLIYYEAYRSEKDARQREHNLKLRANALSQLKRRIVNSLKAN